MASGHHHTEHDDLLARGGRERRAGRWDARDATTDIWQRLSRITMVLIVVVGLCCSLVYFKPQLERRDELKEEVAALVVDYEARRAEADALDAELSWLRSDLNYLESRARDLLDLQKDGEQIIRVIRPD